jgi:lipopolysaccharide export system permease protein
MRKTPLTLDWYMAKRVALPFLAALGVGTSALLMERLIRLLDLFANRGGPIYLIIKMLGFLVPHYLALAIPAAYFIAVVYVTMRLSNDGELDALRASGFSLLRTSAPIIVIGLVLTIVTGILVGSLQPYTRYAYRALAYLVGETSWNAAIERGAFFSGFGGKTMLIGDISKGGRELGQIFIQETDSEDRNVVLTAPTGSLAIDPTDFSLKLELHDGVRIQSTQNGEQVQALEFVTLDLPLQVVAPEPFRNRGDKESELTLTELLKAKVDRSSGLTTFDIRAEINYRWVRIVSVFFLPFLAVPLGLSSRRSPSNIRLLIGIVVLIGYYEIVQLGQSLVSEDYAPAILALWGPFFIFALPSLWLFREANRRVGQDPLAPLLERADALAYGWRLALLSKLGRRSAT